MEAVYILAPILFVIIVIVVRQDYEVKSLRKQVAVIQHTIDKSKKKEK